MRLVSCLAIPIVALPCVCSLIWLALPSNILLVGLGFGNPIAGLEGLCCLKDVFYPLVLFIFPLALFS